MKWMHNIFPVKWTRARKKICIINIKKNTWAIIKLIASAGKNEKSEWEEKWGTQNGHKCVNLSKAAFNLQINSILMLIH